MPDKPRPKPPSDPFGERMFFADELGELFDGHKPYGRSETGFLAGRSFKPAADIHETSDGLVICLEVPGMERDEIDLEITGNVLKVSGSRNFMREHPDEEYIRLERGFGSFERIFEIPGDTDPAKVTAHLERGVLAINVPRRVERRNIPVETGE